MSSAPIMVFDRRAVRAHRARTHGDDFLFREIADRLADRLDDVDRRFETGLVVGARRGVLAEALAARTKFARVIDMDPAAELLRDAGGLRVVAEPDLLPFGEGTLDAVIAVPSLHWVDDLPGALLQLRRALRPDGLLLGALFGGETLTELRGALIDAELAEEGGASPRVSPFADTRDMGALLQRAGFALPVIDSDTLTLTYPDALALMHDLRAMGETNAVAERRRGFTRRATMARAAALYAERHGLPDGRIPATFQVIYLTAWAPAPSQPKPLRPGSAAARLADALGSKEEKFRRS
jgi:NADH dehydrogenase [ubiquinone] 1 alpha subcomplex assembly factor 5